MKEKKDVIDTAFSWHDQGITPLPIVPGTKRALVKWKHWQRRRPPRALIRAWFSRPCRLALMCGTGRLLVLDFDNLALYIRWQRVHQYHYAESYRVRTARPGMHVYFWCDDLPEKSTKLQDVDIKSTGYVLAPPSRGYEVVNENEIMRVAAAEVLVPGLTRDVLQLAEKAENKEGESVQAAPTTATPPPTPFSVSFGHGSDLPRLSPGIAGRIKQRLSILDLCNLYTDMRPSSNGYYWGRCPHPAHEDVNPSFSCSLKTGRAHCWSGNCRLHTENGLDVIDLVSVLEGCKDTKAMAMLAAHLGLVKVT